MGLQSRNPPQDKTYWDDLMADDLHIRLLYLENRVAFARLLFPTEAKLAMDIAEAENLREVDLNETPLMKSKRLLSRMQALSKTDMMYFSCGAEAARNVLACVQISGKYCGCHVAVEMGRRYFPHCSQVLEKFMEDDLPDLVYLEKGTPEEQKIKRERFMELKDEVQKAFNKDKAELCRTGLSPSLSHLL